MKPDDVCFVLVGRGDDPCKPKTMRIPPDCVPQALKNGWYVIGRDAEIYEAFNPPRVVDGDADPA
jgi:hypothetical protein